MPRLKRWLPDGEKLVWELAIEHRMHNEFNSRSAKRRI